MHFYVGDLLQEPIGTQASVELDTGFQDLDTDLSVESIKGKLTLLHTNEGVLAFGTLTVAMDAECVRCLEPATQAVEIEFEERFRPIGQSPLSDLVSPIDADGYVHIKPVLRDLVIVSTPIHILCKPDCRGLCPHCGQNLNKALCDCWDDEEDPRMAALKLLLK